MIIIYFGISIEEIKEGISNYIPSNNRSQIVKKNSNKIVLDAYNANPTSMTLAIKSFDDDRYVFMATLNGTVKKTPLSDFSRPRQTGIKAVQLDAGDYLIGSIITG